MATDTEQILLEIDGVEVVVERLPNGKFRKPNYLKQGEVIGTKRGVGGENMNDIVRGTGAVRSTDDEGGKGVGAYGTGAKQVPVTLEIRAPATEESRKYSGFGTALKPAWEPVVIARKPC